MEFRILGPLEFIDGGARIPLGGAKQRAVLAILLLRFGQVVSTDALIDGLWEHSPPENATNTVQAYISRLRKAMDRVRNSQRTESLIRRRGTGYILEADPAAFDLRRFQLLFREASELLPIEPAKASARLGDALALWRGTPLAEFPTEPFAQTELPRLEGQLLSALTSRVEAELLLGHHSALVGELEALVGEHPLDEGLRGQLMVSLYRSGRQAEALDAFRRARRYFAEELGIDLGRQLQDLEAAILEQDARLDWVPPNTPPPPVESALFPPRRSPEFPEQGTSGQGTAMHSAVGTRIWNVPPRNPHFTGRAETLDELHSRLRANPGALSVQALYGLGGIGKTQLAIEYAHRFADDYSIVWWMDAEQPVLIPEQLIALAHRLGVPAQGAPNDVVDRLLIHLGGAADWLLIWDNAENPEEIAGYRPAGRGHVLVTSRSPEWGALGGRVEVEVLDRAETVTLLSARIPAVTDHVANNLAAELGDLPLAAAQAAAYLEQTGLDPARYLRQFRSRRAALLARGNVLGYQGRVDTAWQLSLERLRAESPTAVAVLETAAFLGPEPIPVSLFVDHPESLDDPLRMALLTDADAIDDAIGAGVGYSLVRRDQDSFQQHRLVQAVIRNQLSSEQRRTVAAQVVRMMVGAHPGDPNDPANWAAFARIAPHVLASAALGDEDADGRQLMLATIGYLNVRGDTRAARTIAEELLARWRRVLGEDHPDTLTASANLTAALAWLAAHDEARALGRDTLRRARRVLGADHPVTLRLATHLTFALAWLGESEEACRLGEDNLKRSQLALGEDSSDTLRLGANLAFALAWHGRAEQAVELGRETLTRARRALGPDHPVTLVAAAHLALALGWLGEGEQDRDLGEDTLARARAALGPDHPTTLGSAVHLAFILVAQGDPAQARTLCQDTLDRSSRALGPDHLITLISAAVLAWALADLGESHGARELSEEAWNRARLRLGDDNLITLMAAGALAAVLAAAGDLERARQLGRETLQSSLRRLGPDHLITQRIAFAVGPSD